MNLIENTILDKIFDDTDDSADVGRCPLPIGKFPKETPLAMAYVPYQSWEEPYSSSVALQRGTIFPSLDKPFIGEEAVK